MPPFTCLRSTRTPIRIESAEYLCETRRKVFEKVIPAPVGVIPRADIVPAHYSIPPGACSRSALRTYLIHILSPIPFCVGALRDRTPVTGYNTPTAHFWNRQCLARCRRRLGRASRAQARGGSLLLAFPIGRHGSRRQRPLPDRPPTLRAFRSVLSRTRPVSTHGFQDSRSYLRRHGVQFRRAHIYYHKAPFAVYPQNATNRTRDIQGACPHAKNGVCPHMFFSHKEQEKQEMSSRPPLPKVA